MKKLSIFLVMLSFIVGCALAPILSMDNPPKPEELVFHLTNPNTNVIFDEIILPAGFDELATDESSREWSITSFIQKPHDCSLEGDFLVISSISQDGMIMFNLLLYVWGPESNPSAKILAMSAVVSVGDEKNVICYWFGDGRRGTAVSREELEQSFRDYSSAKKGV